MTKKQFMLSSILPPLLILLGLSLYPLTQVIQLSLTDQSLIRPDSGQFVGLSNYVRMFSDIRFWNAIKVTAYWQLITVVGSIGFGILIAMLFYRNVGKLLRTLMMLAFIIPAVLPRVAAAYAWRFMYSPLLGIFNYFLSVLRLPIIEFLSKQNTALLSVALVDIWQWGLLFSVIILGLFESVPEEPLEAAQVDGATKFQLDLHVILPIIWPSLVGLTFLKIVESFRSFDLIYIMTKGGPGIATETIDLYAYNVGLAQEGNISYGASISVVMFVITIIIATFLWRLLVREQ